MHEAARHIVVQDGAPGPREGGRLCDGPGRDELANPEVDGEGNAEAVAERLIDKPQA